MKILSLVLAAIPSVARILDNPVVSSFLKKLMGLFFKTEAEKAVDKLKNQVQGRRKASLKRSEAIKNAKKSYTKDIENIINRP